MTTQRALANKERQVQAQRLSRFARASLITLATVLSFVALALLAIDQLYRPDTFVINQLKIQGKFHYLDPADVDAAVGSDALTNFFSVDLDAVKRNVEALSWVQHVDVRREWPNTLLVNVREHIPVMRWNDDKWVTSAGKVISLTGDVRVPSDIVLSANEADAGLVLKSAFVWKKRLAKKQLKLRKVHLSTRRAWVLTLRHAENDADFKLLLGREKVEQRLARFELLFDQHFRKSNKQLQRVDARYPDGLAIILNELQGESVVSSNRADKNVNQDQQYIADVTSLMTQTHNTVDAIVAVNR